MTVTLKCGKAFRLKEPLHKVFGDEGVELLHWD